MSFYETTVTFDNGEHEFELLLTGFAGNDGGQSDVEGETTYTIDGEDYALEELTEEQKAIFFDMELHHWTDKRYNVKTEYPNTTKWDD
ncbi:hypothetical protein AbSZ3_29 [Acinetobacter phage Ab_SZ3]|uniref:Uncharacterized protein n=1 Tax=Acinetobacter phage Ab_SZ3 TaxID=2781361 RepID=A0A873WI35_9CAUD|nr:hypothetical protein AbSZ3_29 [Acinetobacter phage Ab_SZ3]